MDLLDHAYNATVDVSMYSREVVQFPGLTKSLMVNVDYFLRLFERSFKSGLITTSVVTLPTRTRLRDLDITSKPQGLQKR